MNIIKKLDATLQDIQNEYHKDFWVDTLYEVKAELEALQSSSCDTCEYDGTFRYMGKDSKCTRCCNFFSSRYVKKGKRDDNSKI